MGGNVTATTRPAHMKNEARDSTTQVVPFPPTRAQEPMKRTAPAGARSNDRLVECRHSPSRPFNTDTPSIGAGLTEGSVHLPDPNF